MCTFKILENSVNKDLAWKDELQQALGFIMYSINECFGFDSIDPEESTIVHRAWLESYLNTMDDDQMMDYQSTMSLVTSIRKDILSKPYPQIRSMVSRYQAAVYANKNLRYDMKPDYDRIEEKLEAILTKIGRLTFEFDKSVWMTIRSDIIELESEAQFILKTAVYEEE